MKKIKKYNRVNLQRLYGIKCCKKTDLMFFVKENGLIEVKCISCGISAVDSCITYALAALSDKVKEKKHKFFRFFCVDEGGFRFDEKNQNNR